MNNPKLTPEVRAFILELEALTRKHGLAIAGCGCCGSPRIDPVSVTSPEAGYSTADGDGDRLEWLDPAEYQKGTITWDQVKDEVVH